jgi:hypothetical protein
MSRMVLEFHNWRESKPDDKYEIKALFLFTLMTEAERQSGVKADHNKTFWTEARISRDLAARGSWINLSRREKIKAMFRFAQERVQEAGRSLREAPMFWTPTGSLKDGPPWDVSSIQFPKAPPVLFELPSAADPGLESRKAAGLT